MRILNFLKVVAICLWQVNLVSSHPIILDHILDLAASVFLPSGATNRVPVSNSGIDTLPKDATERKQVIKYMTPFFLGETNIPPRVLKGGELHFYNSAGGDKNLISIDTKDGIKLEAVYMKNDRVDVNTTMILWGGMVFFVNISLVDFPVKSVLQIGSEMKQVLTLFLLLDVDKIKVRDLRFYLAKWVCITILKP